MRPCFPLIVYRSILHFIRARRMFASMEVPYGGLTIDPGSVLHDGRLSRHCVHGVALRCTFCPVHSPRNGHYEVASRLTVWEQAPNETPSGGRSNCSLGCLLLHNLDDTIQGSFRLADVDRHPARLTSWGLRASLARQFRFVSGNPPHTASRNQTTGTVSRDARSERTRCDTSVYEHARAWRKRTHFLPPPMQLPKFHRE